MTSCTGADPSAPTGLRTLRTGRIYLAPTQTKAQRKVWLRYSALKAAGVVGAIAERFLIALTAAAEAEWFFFGNNAAVRKSDFSPVALYFGGSIGNDYNF